jgi:PAS domain S-box-containing protein
VKQIAATRFAECRPERADGRFYTDEFQLIAKDGSRVWIESTFRFIRNEETGEPEIVGVSRDITEKRLWKVEYMNYKET